MKISDWDGKCVETGATIGWFTGQLGGNKDATFYTISLGMGQGFDISKSDYSGGAYYGNTWLLGNPQPLIPSVEDPGSVLLYIWTSIKY